MLGKAWWKMGGRSIDRAQRLVNRYCDEFSKLGYGRAPYPKVVRKVPRELGIRMHSDRGMGGFYDHLTDRPYLVFDPNRSRTGLKSDTYHELLHRVIEHRFLQDGYRPEFELGRVEPEWRGVDRWLEEMAMLLRIRFADLVADLALLRLGVARGPKDFSAELDRWMAGPAPLPYTMDPGVQVLSWLSMGTGIYYAAKCAGDRTCAGAMRRMAPKLSGQLDRLFRGLTADASGHELARRFRTFCGLSALVIEYAQTPDGLMHPFIRKISMRRARRVLRSFLRRGTF